MIRGSPKTMKLSDFPLEVAITLRQIATKGRPSLTIFSRKHKHEHKQPTVIVEVQKDHIGQMPMWDKVILLLFLERQ